MVIFYNSLIVIICIYKFENDIFIKYNVRLQGMEEGKVDGHDRLVVESTLGT